jgi:uncharacterized RDD family membrane protein YckC
VTQTPADWYPDPSDDHRLRYWDGSAWTAHVAPSPVPAQPVGPTTPDGEPLAGWWWRALANLIDGTILGALSGIASIPAIIQVQQEIVPVIERLGRELERNPETPPDLGAFYADYFDVLQSHLVALVVPSAVLGLLYLAIFLRWKGATPGKLMLGMRVRLRDQPGRLPWGSIAARLSLQFVASCVVYGAAIAAGSFQAFVVAYVVLWPVLLLDVLWAAWDPKRQALHDMLARTNVVRTR